jgi:hypothetical protein
LADVVAVRALLLDVSPARVGNPFHAVYRALMVA